MIQIPVCQRCGAPVLSDGSCPRCEMALAWEVSEAKGSLPANGEEVPWKRFGEYELLEELGHGGMGVVYKARHVKLDRIVALKLLLLGQFSNEASVRRFQREAQAAASLRHPNIVAIYDVGQVEGQHYFTMEYVEGRSLATLLQAGPLPLSVAAGYCRTIAEAIGTAHRAGIIHRDLKPSNILIDPFDQPRITDFGLAKRFEDPDCRVGVSELTVPGQVLGSPNYLAPELAAGQLDQVGPPSDIFAIGAMLYECLTGRPPFLAATLQETLLRIRDSEPVSPRILDSDVPRDLETVCLKCLEKAPARRYATAEALAQDLNRFLRNEPILARRVGPVGKSWRWCRRKPALAVTILLLHLVLMGGLAGIVWQWRRAESNAASALRARQFAEVESYTSDMNLARQAWEQGSLLDAQHLLRKHIPELGEPDLRGFEWRYLWALCRDESRFTITNSSGECFQSVAIPPIKEFLFACGSKSLRLHAGDSGREVDRLTEPDSSRTICSSAFSFGTSSTIATGDADGVVCLWNWESKSLLSRFQAHQKPVLALAFSPDGKLLVSTDANDAGGGRLRLWRVVSAGGGSADALWVKRLDHICPTVLFSPDGRTVVSAGKEENEGRLAAWEVQTGNELAPFPKEHIGYVTCMAFSPDGKWLAAAGIQPTIRIWEFASRRVVARLSGHLGAVNSLAFCADGNRLISGGLDSTIRIWDIGTSSQINLLRGHRAGVNSVASAPDGSAIFSASSDEIKAWSADVSASASALEAGQSWPGIAISPDRKWLVATEYQKANTIKVWDLESKRFSFNLHSLTMKTPLVTFSPDGHFCVAACEDCKAYVWETAGFNPLAAPLEPVAVLTNDFECTGLNFAPNGQILAIFGPRLAPAVEPSYSLNRLAVWQVNGWKKLDLLKRAGTANSQESVVTSLAFSPDSATAAIGYRDGWVRLWNVREDRLLEEYKDHPAGLGYYVGVNFSHDGRWLASWSALSKVVLHDLQDPQKPKRTYSWDCRHVGWMWAACFDPEDRTLVTSGIDGTIKFWNLATHQVALTLKQSEGPGEVFGFTSDGNCLFSWDACGTVKFWPATSVAAIPKYKTLINKD